MSKGSMDLLSRLQRTTLTEPPDLSLVFGPSSHLMWGFGRRAPFALNVLSGSPLVLWCFGALVHHSDNLEVL